LDKNVLRIENTVETSFLPESELPSHARLSGNTPDAEENDLSEALLQSAAESGKYKINFLLLSYSIKLYIYEGRRTSIRGKFLYVFSSSHNSTN